MAKWGIVVAGGVYLRFLLLLLLGGVLLLLLLGLGLMERLGDPPPAPMPVLLPPSDLILDPKFNRSVVPPPPPPLLLVLPAPLGALPGAAAAAVPPDPLGDLGRGGEGGMMM